MHPRRRGLLGSGAAGLAMVEGLVKALAALK